MKWYYLLAGLTCLCLGGCVAKTKEKSTTTMDQQQDEDSYWHGPGYYKGVWIQTENEFNDWYYRQRMPKAPPKPLSPSSAKSRP